MGRCVCDSQWTGESCDVVKCKENNCSSNGVCSEQGESGQAILYVKYINKMLPTNEILCRDKPNASNYWNACNVL